VILATFLLGLVLVVAATVYVVVRGLELWREAKRVGGNFTTEVALFDERAVRTERLLAEADQSSQALVAAQERLRISIAQLQVLRGALESDRRRLRWLAAFLPPR
jgi:cytochrome c-type biogenesis protein CcmH/NrfG